MKNSKLFKLFVKLYAGDIVKAIYQGILGRQADEVGFAAYFESLKKSGDIESVINEISGSEEAWKNHFYAYPEALVSLVFKGLLAREPEAEALTNYSEKLTEHQNLAEVLSEVGQSQEYWEYILGVNATKIVNGIYLGLLGREADEAGSLTYCEKIKQTGDFVSVITQVGQSQEFQIRSRQESTIGKQNKPELVQRVESINDLYLKFFGRDVSNLELAKHLEGDTKFYQILKNIIDSTTRDSNKAPRVLIFGAYGNGNMGDAYQALAVRSHLKHTWNLKDESIFACSLIEVGDYPFPVKQKLTANAIYDIELLNTFDGIIIGGGGLLAHPHQPLNDAAWADKVCVPMILLGVGASNSTINHHTALLNRALYVSARDDESLKALQTIRQDTVLMHDPILCIQNTEDLIAFDVFNENLSKKCDVLWILKYPSSANDIEMLNWIREKVIEDKDKVHHIVAIEPKLDVALQAYFPNQEIIYLESLLSLNQLIQQSDKVFSMRYHGVIFSLLQNHPLVYGFSQVKIKNLFEKIGINGDYLENVIDINRAYYALGKKKKSDCESKLKRISTKFNENLMRFNMWKGL
ncbi:MAG: polysaccharide pyruvyl transferase family protein [Methylotenera sp.]|uniref:polysaccharide pyruvyl transferase family protein n=1 Tax=Methylotenera sp. TaxID=2051956 RepID=UPI0024892FD6|nr:polysaccharide pyruvyl transferase family protein [Methylotenera sp.]MDI1307900.1 polysaccharide pyruvyl transferase family protein [Methylotenera sp.]